MGFSTFPLTVSYPDCATHLLTNVGEITETPRVRFLIHRIRIFFFKIFSCAPPPFKVFIEFVKILLLFYFFIFLAACEILAPVPGIEPALPAFEDKVITPGPPGKSE